MPTIKVKLSDFAGDLGLPAQELIDCLKKLDDKVRKTSTPLTDVEMNFLLEFYTQAHQVANFDAYYADRSAEEPQQEVKKPTRTPHATKKPEKIEKPEKAEKPAKPKKPAEAAAPAEEAAQTEEA